MSAATTAQSGGFWRRAWDAVDERVGLSALAYPVPEHANGIGYILGGITFFGFLILAATGIWLAQFYHASPEAARQSVLYIDRVAPLGDVARGVHFWTANIVMATGLLHLGRVFATGSYKRPREANWVIGVGLLATTVGMLFTGTVVKWDQEAYEALGHAEEAGALLGGLGFWFSDEFTATLPLLGRLYIAHIFILPAIGTLLLVGHFLLVKRHGISARPAEADLAVDGGPRPAAGGSMFSAHVVRMTGFGLIVLAVSVGLTLVLPPLLGPQPVPGVELTKPPWLFLPIYPLEDWFGLGPLVWLPVFLFVSLALVPFIDRSPYRSMRRRRVIIAAGLVVVVALVVLGLLAALTPPNPHLMEG